MIADALGRIPMSSNLAASLSRASGYAEAQLHREVALEHLLLALTEDADALQILAASNIDVGRVISDVSGYLGRLEDRNRPEDASRLSVSGDLKRILEAAAAASRGRRREINGAIVLAAIVGDARTTAAHILQAQGLTFEETIRVLQRTMVASAAAPTAPPPVPAAAPPPLPQPAPGPVASAGTEDLLAQARARVTQARIPAEEPEPVAGYEAAPPPPSYAEMGSAEPPQASEPHHVPAAAYEPAASPAATLWPETAAPDVAHAGPHSYEHVHAHVPPQRTAELPVVAEVEHSIAETAIAPEPAEPIADEAAAYAPAVDGDMIPAPWPEAPPEEPASAPYGHPGLHPPVYHQPAHPSAYPEPSAVPAPGAASGWPEAVADPMPPSPQPYWTDATAGNAMSPAVPPPLPPIANRAPRPAPRVPGAAFPSQPPSFREPQLPPHPVYPRWPEPSFERAHAAPDPVPPPFHAPEHSSEHVSGHTPGHNVPGHLPGHIPGQGYAPSMPAQAAPNAPRWDAPTADLHPFGAGPPPAPVPAPSLDELNAARETREEPSFTTGEAQARGTIDVEPGKLVENIPRTMRVGVTSVIEVRIAKAAVKALAEGMAGQPYQHQVLVTKAMSVRLRAPEGGFFIEMASPETQWIENTLGLMSDDFASWRWSVTPRRRGKLRLQLTVAARTVGRDGSTAETALPDQLIDVRVATNYGQSMRRWAGWIAAAILGGALGKFGEQILSSLNKVLGLLAAG